MITPTAPAGPVAHTPEPSRLRALDPRHNSLNLVRLILAALVLVAHSFTLTGNGFGPTFNHDHLGTWAVYAFFCLSGYLITGSRLRTAFPDYLIHRIARIFPGFLVSLVMVAFVFAPIAYLRENGSLAGFLSTPTTPAHFVYINSLLRIGDYSVAGTLTTVPYPGAWNGSLWSLYYEFLCYLLVGALGVFGWTRRNPTVLVVAFAVSVYGWAHRLGVMQYLGSDADMELVLKMVPFFLGGAVIWTIRDRVPLEWYTALPALAGYAGVVLWQGDWGPQLGAPLFTVFLLWLGKALPSPNWIRHNDISYGCYVYAFPSQQLVAVLGGAALGVAPYIVLAAIPTVVLATLSWRLVERPAMRAVRGRKPALNEG